MGISFPPLSYPALLSQPSSAASSATSHRIPIIPYNSNTTSGPKSASTSFAVKPNPSAAMQVGRKSRIGQTGSSNAGLAAISTTPTTKQPSLQKTEEETKPKKRGRKKLKDPEELAAEGEQEAQTTRSKRMRQASPDTNEKRKVQNRAAQRAFRERKEKHVKDLEERVVAQDEQLSEFRSLTEQLLAVNEALRRGEAVPVREWIIPLALPSLSALSPPRHSPESEHEHEAEQEQLIQVEEHKPDIATLIAPSFDPMAASTYSDFDPSLLNIDTSNATLDQPELNFDFDAPIDFSNAIPLPPLFQDIFSESFTLPPTDPTNPTSASLSSAFPNIINNSSDATDLSLEDEDLCPMDDDEDPPTLPNGRVPCDKPECDFGSLSCALPIPWRPAAIDKDVPSKDVWVCHQAWGKLCSHPMFGQCDVDELCRELRDKTRCSDDGRLVITKSDVCDVFRSIPGRARARRIQLEMAGKE